MARITVTVELPEGLALDTSAYKASHGTPDYEGFGSWGFAPGTAAEPVGFDGRPETGAVWLDNCTLAEALEQLGDRLPLGGQYHLLP
jgi:hypothetical protein